MSVYTNLIAGVLVSGLASNCGEKVPVVPTDEPDGQKSALDEQKFPKHTEAAERLGLDEIPYIRDDSFNANPSGLLGQVLEIRKSGAECPERAVDGKAEFAATPLQVFEVDAASILQQPVKRETFIVNKSLATSVAFLSYLSVSLDSESVFSLMVFDQSAGRVDDKKESWPKAVTAWKESNKAAMEDVDVCYIAVVKGYVQKNVIRRKFKKTTGEAGGGAYGVNVEGSFMTSEEDYSIDVRFGLSTAILKRPPSDKEDQQYSASEDAEFLASLVEVSHPE